MTCVLLVFGAPCQLPLLAGPEHGRTIPLADIRTSPDGLCLRYGRPLACQRDKTTSNQLDLLCKRALPGRFGVVSTNEGIFMANPTTNAPAVTEERVQRRLAAILAADVVGYSALMQRAEEATYAEFERLKRDLIAPSLSRHDGRLIKTTGDGALAEFASPLAAVRC